jgi:hypothetical protein
MSTEGLLFSGIIILAALAWIGLPLLGRERGRAHEALIQKQRDRLLIHYERVLTNIRDLDEDHATGKMADDDHQTEREIWVRRGIEALKALDELNADHPLAARDDEADIDRAIEDTIEQAVAAYRTKATIE